MGKTFSIPYQKTGQDFYFSDHRVGQDLCQSNATSQQEFHITDHSVGQEFCQTYHKTRQFLNNTDEESKTGIELYYMTDHRAGQDLFGYKM